MDVEEELKEGELPEGMHVDIPEEDVVAVVDPLLEEDEIKENSEAGMYGDDAEFEKMLFSASGYEEL